MPECKGHMAKHKTIEGSAESALKEFVKDSNDHIAMWPHDHMAT